MSNLYSRDNLTTTEVTPGLLHEVAASLLRNTTKEDLITSILMTTHLCIA